MFDLNHLDAKGLYICVFNCNTCFFLHYLYLDILLQTTWDICVCIIIFSISLFWHVKWPLLHMCIYYITFANISDNKLVCLFLSWHTEAWVCSLRQQTKCRVCFGFSDLTCKCFGSHRNEVLSDEPGEELLNYTFVKLESTLLPLAPFRLDLFL